MRRREQYTLEIVRPVTDSQGTRTLLVTVDMKEGEDTPRFFKNRLAARKRIQEILDAAPAQKVVAVAVRKFSVFYR